MIGFFIQLAMWDLGQFISRSRGTLRRAQCPLLASEGPAVLQSTPLDNHKKIL